MISFVISAWMYLRALLFATLAMIFARHSATVFLTGSDDVGLLANPTICFTYFSQASFLSFALMVRSPRISTYFLWRRQFELMDFSSLRNYFLNFLCYETYIMFNICEIMLISTLFPIKLNTSKFTYLFKCVFNWYDVFFLSNIRR